MFLSKKAFKIQKSHNTIPDLETDSRTEDMDYTWVPAHCGIEGKADKHAEARNLNLSEVQIFLKSAN